MFNRQQRENYLKKFPACEFCLSHGSVKPATMVYRRPGWEIWLSYDVRPDVSMCESCYDQTVQAEKLNNRPLVKGFNLEGWPLDPRWHHPWYSSFIRGIS